MILFDNVVEILDFTDFDGGAVLGIIALDGRFIGRTPIDGDLLRHVSGTRICRKTVDLKMRTTKGWMRMPPVGHEVPVATPSEAGFTIRVAPSCDSSCLQ